MVINVFTNAKKVLTRPKNLNRAAYKEALVNTRAVTLYS